MEKTVYIDEKPVRLKSTAALPKRYKAQFRRDYFADLLKIAKVFGSGAKKRADLRTISFDDLNHFDMDVLYDIAGGTLYAAGIYTFAKNAEFAPGGVSGLALILNHLSGLPVGTTTLLLNIPLIAVSYKLVGKRFLMKSAVSMLVSNIILDGIFPLLRLIQAPHFWQHCMRASFWERE